MSWVTKKMNDMNVEEKQEYAKHRKRQSRENDSKEKKIAQNIKKKGNTTMNGDLPGTDKPRLEI